jgi:hypothetical protein
MKVLAALSVIALIVLAIPHAIGQRSADRPPGVDASNWVAINDNLGVVLVPPPGSESGPRLGVSRQALLLAVPSNGYFMIRTGTHWRRLVVVEPIRGPGDAG